MSGAAAARVATRDPLDVLRTVWGYPAFRGLQEEVIRHVLAGGDALVLMPTGGGKSLCYQVPALCLDGLTVVVSPLIALMQDQVAALAQLGVRAAMLNSTLDFRSATAVERAMRDGQLDLVYVAPERLKATGFLDLLGRCRLALFAIDEAHCVSQWGHDFRPDYLELKVLHERFPAVPRMALTATADAPTRREIVERLDLGQGRSFVAGFDRPNIRYRVVPKLQPKAQLLRYLKGEQAGNSGIVYCLSRRKVDDTAAALSGLGIAALPYHAGLDKEVRAANQDRFLKEDGRDRGGDDRLRHGHRQAGRALRRPSRPAQEPGGLLPGDRPRRPRRAAGRGLHALRPGRCRQAQEPARRAETTSERQRHVERQKLEAMLGYCETTRCRRQVLLGYFGEERAEPCGNCDVCLERPESFDGTELARKALSAVYRTGQRFGAGHVIDVLRGESNEKTGRLGHERAVGVRDRPRPRRVGMALGLAPARGPGPDRDRRRGPWRAGASPATAGPCSRASAASSCAAIRRRHGRAGKARAGRACRPRLPTRRARRCSSACAQWRMQTARAQGVPPYVIFHDATLQAIATVRPADPRATSRACRAWVRPSSSATARRFWRSWRSDAARGETHRRAVGCVGGLSC